MKQSCGQGTVRAGRSDQRVPTGAQNQEGPGLSER